MRKYVQAYRDAFGTGLVKDDIIKQHIKQQAVIDNFLPDSASFFYIVEAPSLKYHFFGRQQESLSGYSNKEFLDGGIDFFIQCLHPDEVDIILNQVYPIGTEYIFNTIKENFINVVWQYNFRFKKKSGEYINLMEQVYFLETDSNFKPTLLLGNIITLGSQDILPLRASLRLYKDNISETVFSKKFTNPDSSINHVTVREMDILRNLANGKTSKEIGEALFISPHTVDTHRRNLLAKLKCKSVVELTRFAFKNGLL